MNSFTNTNITKLIFCTISGFKIRQFTEKVKNKQILEILCAVLANINIYKALGREIVVVDNIKPMCLYTAIPNGNILIATNHELKELDVNSYKYTKSTIINFYAIRSLILLNNKIVALANNGAVKVFDTQQFDCIYSTMIKGYNHFNNLLLLTNGNFACTSCYQGDYFILILDSKFRGLKNVYYNTWITCLINVGDDKFASAAYNWTVNIYDINNNYSCIKILNGHSQAVNALIYLAKSNLLLSGSNDNTIKVWDIKTYVCIKTIETCGKIISLLLLSEQYFASVSCSGVTNIKIWTISDYQCVNAIQDSKNKISSLILLKDGRVVALAGEKIIIYSY
jgi:WD40 repeat protein